MRFTIVTLLILSFSFQSEAQFWKSNEDKKEKKEKKQKRNKSDLNSMFSVGYEGDLSSSFGANHLLADHQVLTRLENRFIPEKLFRKDNTISKVGNTFYRMGKMFLLDYTLNYQTYSIQRNVFGTKFRLEESGATNTSVNLSMPKPYNSQRNTVTAILTDSISPFQQALNLAAAMEGSSVMSDLSRKNMIINPDFAYEEALLYLFSNNDLAAHVALFKDDGFNEVYSYVDQINSMYTEANLSVDKLKMWSILDMGLDPMNIASVVGIGKYIVKGEELTDMLWLKFGEKAKWLPSVKMNLAPFGPEMVYQNFLKLDRTMFEFDVHHAVGGYVSSLGLDLKAMNMLFGEKKKLAVDGIMSFWNQPEFTFKKGATFQNFEGFGGSAQVNFNYKPWKLINAYIQGTVGYKSKGYQEGLNLDSDLILKIGISFR